MLFQEPAEDYVKLNASKIQIPRSAIAAVADCQPSPDCDKLRVVLAICSDTGSGASSLSVDSGLDSTALRMEMPTSDPSVCFLDTFGRCVFLYKLSRSASDSASEFLFFQVEDGAFVHVVEKAAGASAHPVKPETLDASSRAAAFRGILIRVLVVNDTRSHNLSEHASWQSAFRQCKECLRTGELHGSTAVTLAATLTVDASDLLERQKAQLSRASFSCPVAVDGVLALLPPSVGMLVEDDTNSTLGFQTLLLADRSWPLRTLHAAGAVEHQHQFTLELPCNNQSKVSPPAVPNGDSASPVWSLAILPESPNKPAQQSIDTPNQQPGGRLWYGNVSHLMSLLRAPEITVGRTPWAKTFAYDMQQLGYHGTAAQGAKEFLDKKLQQTDVVVKSVRKYRDSDAFRRRGSYWSRELRDFILALGFSDSSLVAACSSQPHVNGLVRLACKNFLDEVLAQCTGAQQDTRAADLRLIAGEQVAEYEYTQSILKHKVLQQPVWPSKVAETLRLLEFPDVANLSPRSEPLQPLAATAQMRHAATEFLRARNDVCPMESVEETILRRCTETLSSSYLSTAIDPWPQELRSFFLMLDFFPSEMKRPAADAVGVGRALRDHARQYVSIRSEGKDPKVEIARALLQSPSMRSSRPFTEYQVEQLHLLGFPFKDHEAEQAKSAMTFRGESALFKSIQAFLGLFVKCHETSPRLSRFRELANSPFFQSTSTYWPQEIRSFLAGHGLFANQLNTPVHLMLSVPAYLRDAAKKFIEVTILRDFGDLLATFPDANVCAFCDDPVAYSASLELDDDSAAAKQMWTLADKAAADKDCLREETLSGKSGVRPRLSLREAISIFDNDCSGVTGSSSPSKPTPSAVVDSNHVLVAKLSLSAFCVSGQSSQPNSSTNTCPQDLNAFMAASSLAKHEFLHHTIRPVASIAFVHDDTTASCVLASSAHAAFLVNHTWASVPIQPLSQKSGGLSALKWTPALLGSEAAVSDVHLGTTIHAGVFQAIQSANAPVGNTAPAPLAEAPAAIPSERPYAVEKGSDVSSIFANPSRVQPQQQNFLGKFDDPYSATGLRSQGQHASNTLSLSPIPVSARARVPPPNLRSRLGMRPAPSHSYHQHTSTAPASINPFERPITPPRQTSNPFASAASSSLSNPFASPYGRGAVGGPQSAPQQETDEDILRMIKSAESSSRAAAPSNPFSTNASSLARPTTITTRANDLAAKRQEWARQRQENLSRLRNTSSSSTFSGSRLVVDELSPVEIPNSHSPVPLGNVSGRRGPALDFDNIPLAASRAPAAFDFSARPPQRGLPLDEVPVGSHRHQTSRIESEAQRVKEEIDTGDDIFSRRRGRDTLSITPVKSQSLSSFAGGPAAVRRRVEPTNGLERFAAPPPQRNVFDDDPFMSNTAPPARRPTQHPWDQLDERPAVSARRNPFASSDDPVPQLQPAHAMKSPFDDIPVGGAARRQLTPAVEIVGAGRPPLSVSAARPPPLASASMSASTSASTLKTMSSAERQAAAAARRAALRAATSGEQQPISSSDSVSRPQSFDEVPAVASRRPPTNPFDEITVAVPKPRPRPLTTASEPQVTVFTPQRPPISQRISPFDETSYPRNGQFGTTISANIPRTPTGVSASERAFEEQRRNEDAMRLVRQDQAAEMQRQREQEATERQRRHEQLVQDRVRQVLPAGTTQSVTFSTGEPTSTTMNSSIRPSNRTYNSVGPLKGIADESTRTPLADVSVSTRAMVAACLSAQFDRSAYDDEETRVLAALRKCKLNTMAVLIVPPDSTSQTHASECGACVVVVVPLAHRSSSSEGHVFHMLIRHHCTLDLLHLLEQRPLASLAAMRDASRQRRRPKDGRSHLSWQEWRRLCWQMWRHSLKSITSSRSCGERKILGQHCDPHVTEARARSLCLRFQLFFFQRGKVASRIARQKDFQNQIAGLGLRRPDGPSLRATIFTEPLEVLSREHSAAPLDTVLSASPAVGFSSPNDDMGNVTLTVTSVAHLLRKQREWIDDLNPLTALFSLSSLRSLERSSSEVIGAPVAVISAMRLVDDVFSVGHLRFCRAQPHATPPSMGEKLLRLGELYVKRILIMAAFIFLLEYVHVLLVCGAGVFVLWRSIVSRYDIDSASAEFHTTASLRATENTGSTVKRKIATIISFATLAARLRRAWQGHSIVFAHFAFGGAVLTLACFVLLWCLVGYGTPSSAPSSQRAQLTDRDRYLGLSHHLPEDLALHSHAYIVAESDEAILSKMMEMRVYAACLLVAPFQVNPVLWVARWLLVALLRDEALRPLFL